MNKAGSFAANALNAASKQLLVRNTAASPFSPLSFARKVEISTKYNDTVNPVWKDRMVELVDLVQKEQSSLLSKKMRANKFNFE